MIRPFRLKGYRLRSKTVGVDDPTTSIDQIGEQIARFAVGSRENEVSYNVWICTSMGVCSHGTDHPPPIDSVGESVDWTMDPP